MIFTVNGRDVVACDDDRCGAWIEVAFADEDGWALAGLSGPHYCPFGVTLRFRSLIDSAFGPPPA